MKRLFFSSLCGDARVFRSAAEQRIGQLEHFGRAAVHDGRCIAASIGRRFLVRFLIDRPKATEYSATVAGANAAGAASARSQGRHAVTAAAWA